MSFAVDTNVLLRSIDDGHIAQPIARDGLLTLRDRGEILSIFPQNLIELWAVATRPLANNGLGWGVERTEQELAALKNLFVVLADTDGVLAEWEKTSGSASSHWQTSSRRPPRRPDAGSPCHTSSHFQRQRFQTLSRNHSTEST